MNPSPAIGNTKSGNNAGDALLWAAGSTETMYYVHKDYASATLSTGLGSISAITDATGNLLESLSYDAWGRSRKATDWTDYNVTSTLFDRGFTGHEHLPHFGLINMNGRVYDPFLARFLSPDPFVQAPGYTQNYNRYSYAWNNPLKYTDPDGEWVHLVVGAVIGGIVNWAVNGAQFNAKGLGYFGVGALAGGLSAGIGAGFGTLAAGSGSFSFMSATGLTAAGFGPGAAAGAGAGFTSGFVTGTGNSLMQGEKLKQSLGKGLHSGAIGMAIGGLTGGIQGGIRAARMGNDFWSGNGTGGRYGVVPQVDKSNISYSQGSSLNTENLVTNNIGGIGEPNRYYLEVNRFYENDQATFSNFSFPDGTNGYFLEPAGPSSIIEGSGKRISSGLYEVVNHNGRRWQGVLRLNNVPGRSGILMHPGLVPNHTTGCLIPGLSFIPGMQPFSFYDAIFSSRAAMNRLLELSNSFDHFILIIK
jgi:RHS repeat-associated protein